MLTAVKCSLATREKPRATEHSRAVSNTTSRLSQRVFLLRQILPFALLAIVMFYEVARHLLFPHVGHPSLLAIEVLMFGIGAPAMLWLTLQWIGLEIRAREEAENQAELRQRMLLEMQHRIKNNLQTVADLLSLELTRATHPDAAQSLRDSVMRIKTIAAAHELLTMEQIGTIDAVELARRVAENARAAQAGAGQTIALRVTGEPLPLSSKAATAFALVVNELVSNALEHGLKGLREGQIEIRIADDQGWMNVVIHDNGVGLKSGFDPQRNAGLGLRIVRTLIEKDLRGWFTLSNDQGTRAEFSFPLANNQRPTTSN